MRANAVACFIYAAVLLGCGLGIYFTLQAGKRLEPARAASEAPAPSAVSAAAPDGAADWWRGTREALRQPLPLLLLIQLVLIVTLARFFAAHSARLGLPGVIGEMIADIVLGPSVAGALAPGLFAFAFPATSLGGGGHAQSSRGDLCSCLWSGWSWI